MLTSNYLKLKLYEPMTVLSKVNIDNYNLNLIDNEFKTQNQLLTNNKDFINSIKNNVQFNSVDTPSIITMTNTNAAAIYCRALPKTGVLYFNFSIRNNNYSSFNIEKDTVLFKFPQKIQNITNVNVGCSVFGINEDKEIYVSTLTFDGQQFKLADNWSRMRLIWCDGVTVDEFTP